MSSILQAIEIAPEWHKKININSKNITIRLGMRNYSKGRTMLCCPKTSWCAERNVVDVEHTDLRNISDYVAQEDGFKDNLELKNKLKEYYSNVDDDSIMTIIRWE
jgi:hypothetical protein